mmetsp:Transcript_28791/g.63482  ORF Transcript_28791/g.63482 Transcript_28791/m.63482 type:complete len:279 (+) Transcript_28791:201-1037(+)
MDPGLLEFRHLHSKGSNVVRQIDPRRRQTRVSASLNVNGLHILCHRILVGEDLLRAERLVVRWDEVDIVLEMLRHWPTRNVPPRLIASVQHVHKPGEFGPKAQPIDRVGKIQVSCSHPRQRLRGHEMVPQKMVHPHLNLTVHSPHVQVGLQPAKLTFYRGIGGELVVLALLHHVRCWGLPVPLLESLLHVVTFRAAVILIYVGVVARSAALLRRCMSLSLLMLFESQCRGQVPGVVGHRSQPIPNPLPNGLPGARSQSGLVDAVGHVHDVGLLRVDQI